MATGNDGRSTDQITVNKRLKYEARLRQRSMVVAGVSTAIVVLSIVLLVPLAPGWEGVKTSFFNGEVFAKTLPKLLKAFLWDVAIFAWSVPLIFALGLAIALDVQSAPQHCFHCGYLGQLTLIFFVASLWFW